MVIIPLDNIFLNISDDIEIKFPCIEKYFEIILKTYVDFDNKIYSNFNNKSSLKNSI
jgi:hypothetical protein